MRTHVLAFAAACLLVPALTAASPGSRSVVTGTQETPAPPPRKEVKVPEKVLKTYVGEYEMGPERILTLTLEDGSLWGQPTNQPKRQLFAESQTKFFLKDLPVQITFQKDPKGNVAGMVMDQEGRPQRELKKIK